ncbi:MAG: tyrosine-type recombinase/integrase [SAR324 cluster bacterium]|nr:tyrosine-type recombinase/integrase [SAR324 cluster bacterium]
MKQLSGVEDFVLHDLRRTAASYMASLGVGTNVISKILNHVESGVTAVYNRHSYDPEKREGLAKWESKLSEIVGTGVKPDLTESRLS